MPKVDDLSAIGAPATVQPAPAPPAAAAPAPAPTAKARPARKAKALTWEQRHVHKKIWFEREQLAKVQARLTQEGDNQTVAALIKELFDGWLEQETPDRG
jgi:hypothetical protein